MTFLCLFVVLGALFITVFNSRTANHIPTSDSVLPTLPKSVPPKTVSKKSDTKPTSLQHPEAAFNKKEQKSTVLPTFS